MNVIAITERLTLRGLNKGDAEFIYELMNSPGWIEHIGDRNINTIDDASAYLVNRLMASYRNHGFGLFHTSITSTAESIGICGLVKRDSLDYPDIGFAFLERYMGQGYGVESSQAVLKYSAEELGLDKIVAITSPENERSQRLLQKIGLEHTETIQIPDYEGDNFYFE